MKREGDDLMWPLSASGNLPDLLFDGEYMEQTFFRIAPMAWNCTAQSVRKGIKTLCKQSGNSKALEELKNASQEVRDRNLLKATFDDARCRSKLSSLRVVRGMRGPNRGMYSPVTTDFARCVFELRYPRSKDPSKKEFWQWVKLNAEKKPGPTSERFFKAATIKHALNSSPCPLAVTDIEFARAMALFAAIIPENEALSLLKAVAEHGSTHIKDFIDAALEPAQPPAANQTEIGSQIENNVLAPDVINEKRPPKISNVRSKHYSSSPQLLTDEAGLQISSLERMRQQDRQSTEDAASIFAAGVEQFLSSSEETRDKILSRLSRAHTSRRSYQAQEQEVTEAAHALMQEASSLVGIHIEQLAEVGTAEDYARLAVRTKALASTYDIKIFSHFQWKKEHEGSIQPESLEPLPLLRASCELLSIQKNEFINKAKDFLTSSPATSVVRSWICQLGLDEIMALVDYCASNKCFSAAAILVRLGLDAHRADFSRLFCHRMLSATEGEERRKLLRFCDPSTAMFDADIELRRIVIVERLRDVINFGPIAALSDPSTGFYDRSIVGESAAQLIQLIGNHLDIIGSAPLQRPILQHFAGDSAASAAAVHFFASSERPAGLITKLQASIREARFSNILNDNQLDLLACRRLLRALEDHSSREVIISSAAQSVSGSSHLEERHRIQLGRFLDEAMQLIIETLSWENRGGDQRRSTFQKDLSQLAAQLAKSGRVGEVDWLENELFKLITAESQRPLLPTLLGDHQLITERIWRETDTQWAQAEIDISEFYSRRPVNTVEILCSLITWVSLERTATTADIVDALVSGKQFPAALSAIAARSAPESKDRQLKRRVETAAAPLLAAIRRRVEGLTAQYGSATVAGASYAGSVEAALLTYDTEEAASLCDLLEVELYEAASREAKAAADIAMKQRHEELLGLLLASEAPNLDRSATVEELESRWKAELASQAPRRAHYTRVAKMVGAFNSGLAEFANVTAEIEAVETNCLKPQFWLSENNSTTLADFIDKSATKIETWLASASEYRPNSRRALASVLKTYLNFFETQVQALRSLGSDGVTDTVFEHVYEFSEIVRRAANPLLCAQELVEAGEMPKLTFEESELTEVKERGAGDAVDSTLDLIQRIQSALHAKSWAEALVLCRNARQSASDEHVLRVDQTSDFCHVMISLEAGDDTSGLEVVETAAAVLGTAGHPVNRSLSSREQLSIALALVEATLTSEGPKAVKNNNSHPNRWSELIALHPDLFKSLNDGTKFQQTGRVLNQLLSGTAASDVSERLWASATNHPEPGQIRADFLRFLLDHRHHSAILSLANRYEPTLRLKLEQLFELRAAAFTRADLVQVAQAVAEQTALAARPGPFRTFVRRLPTAPQTADGALSITLDRELLLRTHNSTDAMVVEVPITASAKGMVPDHLQVQLFPEDDVSFSDHGGRLKTLYEGLLYTATDFSIRLLLGKSWSKRLVDNVDLGFRLRFSARTVTGEIVTRDEACVLRRLKKPSTGARTIDNETLREYYPGVDNTPAEGDSFIGRLDELEQLQEVLVAARQPSPVLLTGMRRIGKTSLLFAFHKRFKAPGSGQVATVYLSIAELRNAFMAGDQTVSSAIFRAITRALAKRHFANSDHNRGVGEKLQERHGNDRSAVRREIEDCYDPESLADSVMVLSEKLLSWIGGSAERIVYLIDEAEALVVPYNAGGDKRLELEQFLQSLREVSQTSSNVGILLSGSNHIGEFTRTYKNAFFGSCVRIELGGIEDSLLASKIVAPERVRPFVQFEADAVDYAVKICAGMPQFMWQVGAATASRVRSGPALRSDVRSAVSALVDAKQDDLPFTLYDVLEPLEHMISLQGRREEDLCWLILRRVAVNSSLLAGEAPKHFLIEQGLLELDSREAWQRRLTYLLGLEILTAPHPHSYSFRVPLFAEAFRAPRNEHEYAVRVQRAAL